MTTSRRKAWTGFSGQITVTVDTSHNQRVEDFTSNGEVQVNWVEATPSYTQINHTIPNWGQSGGQVDYPAPVPAGRHPYPGEFRGVCLRRGFPLRTR